MLTITDCTVKTHTDHPKLYTSPSVNLGKGPPLPSLEEQLLLSTKLIRRTPKELWALELPT